MTSDSTPMIAERVEFLGFLRNKLDSEYLRVHGFTELTAEEIQTAADTIEAQAAEIARLNIGLQVERQATEYWRDFNARSQSQALQLEYDAERLEDERDDLKEDEASFKATIAKLRARAEAQAARITELERERDEVNAETELLKDVINDLQMVSDGHLEWARESDKRAAALEAENAVLREALRWLVQQVREAETRLDADICGVAECNAVLSAPNERASRMVEAYNLAIEVAKCGIEHNAGKYLTVQIDRDTWNALTRLDTQGE